MSTNMEGRKMLGRPKTLEEAHARTEAVFSGHGHHLGEERKPVEDVPKGDVEVAGTEPQTTLEGWLHSAKKASSLRKSAKSGSLFMQKSANDK